MEPEIARRAAVRVGYKPVIPALQRLRREESKLKDNLGYVDSSRPAQA